MTDSASGVFLNERMVTGMADRYFNHIVGCLESSIETAEDGVDCRISAVTVQSAVDLLKEQNERIEKMRSLLGEADEEIKRLKEENEILDPLCR